nr:MAG: ORF1 [TTV-like mini virus]
MPFFRPRRYYRKKYNPWRRYWFGTRRTRTTFRRKRRRQRVRRKKFFKYRLKKLRTLKLKVWQPEKIRKCRIKGILELIECGDGRLSNNFTMYKESYVPPHEPGGGGWSIQQLTLGNLYVQNKYGMNYWTVSNRGYNLMRYLGVNITLYRQQNVDYIFHYNLQDPQIVTKYTYASYHPYKLLNFNRKIIVPSLRTAPLKKKLYKKKFIRPPRKMINQWYFQEHLTNYPLLTFFTTAIDLNNTFLPPLSQNNNITLHCLNTQLFQHPNFQTPSGTTGFSPGGNQYIYGHLKPPEPWISQQLKTFVFLGDTLINEPGQPMNNNPSKLNWGNIFNYEYFQMHLPTYVGTETLDQAKNSDKQITFQMLKKQPYYEDVRYNPNKDDGDGNEAYFVTNFEVGKKNWDPPDNQDLIIRGHPLWLMLWGFEDYINKTNKFHNLDLNGILVIRTKKFSGPQYPAYIILSDSFVNGQGPYHQDRDEINTFNNTHWFPRWKFQKEAVESILQTGPAVYKQKTPQSIQAHMRYNFLLKWGGNPSNMETIADPTAQPTGPDPNQLLLPNEIISPENTIANYIYKWDTRRDLLTQAATKRIKECQIYDSTLFTDGKQSTTDIPLQICTETQEKETTEEQEKTLLFQLQQLQQLNEQLQQRFLRLRQLTMHK